MNKENSIDNENPNCQFIRQYSQKYLQELFLSNEQKSLTSRRNSQFIPYIDE